MKLYIAGHNQEEAKILRTKLDEKGHEVTARWLNRPYRRTKDISILDREEIANDNLQDVTIADALVLMAGPNLYPGGKFVETGVALGRGKVVYILGRRENIILYHPDVIQCDSVDDLVMRIPK